MISIIIPTFNEEKSIAKTLHSLQALTLPYEIIVTDGGSTDKTIEIARALTEKVYIHPKDKKQTISSNRNNGAQYATGDYIVFIDCDCVIPDINSFFAKVLGYMNAHTDTVAMTVWVKTDPAVETWADKLIIGILNYDALIRNNILGIGVAIGKFQFMRREAFLKVKGYREDLVTGEDHDMFHRLSKIGKTYMDKNLLVFHSNRRAHTIGWPRLLWTRFVDTIAIMVTGKSRQKEWKAIR
jgi:glycosyltransferase involved in cell wall biosynthesis